VLPVRYDVMVDARGSEGIAMLDRTLERLREIARRPRRSARVLSAMRELAGTGSQATRHPPTADPASVSDTEPPMHTIERRGSGKERVRPNCGIESRIRVLAGI
jgi:hypothetical protein